MDIVGSALLLVVTSPVFLVVAAAIKLDSPGPVFFKQTRVGRGGAEFTMVKFRSMVHDNDESVHREYYRRFVEGRAESRRNEEGDEVFLLDDARVTRVGRILRRTSLDELPNLLNVLRGEMSLVGPRPPISYEVEFYDEHALRKLLVKPGMTGLAQVSGRGALTFDEVIGYDLDYIDRRSLRMDVGILLRTIPAVARRRGV
ncbi:MAG: sugar transferase [Gammaproteobacteria bacterium]|nr:sugar transferase [Gammaproteobacteria bacterium]